MGKYNIIVAIDEHLAIGKGNQMLTHLPADLRYFKKVTSGHTVVMGYNTFLSLPNGALPNRRNIVLSRKSNLVLADCEVMSSIEEVLDSINDKEIVFFIGGGQIYKEVLEKNIVDTLFITQIHHKFDEASVFFPEIDPKVWELKSQEKHFADEKNLHDYTFEEYSKILFS